MKKHRWWHIFYGKEYHKEVVYKGDLVETSNYWSTCRLCGEQLGEKTGATTFGPIKIKVKMKD